MWQVLIADDNEGVLDRIQRIVELWDDRFEVIRCQDVESANTFIDATVSPISLAIIDLQLPSKKQEGLLVATHLRMKHPGCFIILASGYANSYSYDPSVIDTFVSYLQSPEDYRTQLERHLDNFIRQASPVATVEAL